MAAIGKDWVLTTLLAMTALFAIAAMLPVRVTPVLTLEVSRNGTAISDLQQARSVTARKQVRLDVLDLSHRNRLWHPRLGDIGYGENFFVDLETSFTVKQAGDYRFAIASDDGFAIEIDGAELCSFTGGRPLTMQSCGVALDAGPHRFRLSYFQGSGPAGLTLKYARQNERRTWWFGEDSPYFAFAR